MGNLCVDGEEATVSSRAKDPLTSKENFTRDVVA